MILKDTGTSSVMSLHYSVTEWRPCLFWFSCECFSLWFFGLAILNFYLLLAVETLLMMYHLETVQCASTNGQLQLLQILAQREPVYGKNVKI